MGRRAHGDSMRTTYPVFRARSSPACPLPLLLLECKAIETLPLFGLVAHAKWRRQKKARSTSPGVSPVNLSYRASMTPIIADIAGAGAPEDRSAARTAGRTAPQYAAGEAGGGEAQKPRALGITREIPRHSAQILSSKQISTVDEKTGEINNFSYDEKSSEFRESFDPIKHQFEKWWMLRAAQKLLSSKDDHEFRFKTFDFEDYCMTLGAMPGELTDGKIRRDAIWSEKIVFKPVHQVVTCHKDKVTFDKQPEIWQSEKTGKARFHKVKVCGSVWTCPVCSSAITEARRTEVANAVKAAVARDWDVMLVTFTLRHGAGDDLQKLTEGLKLAQDVLQKSYVWKNLIRRKATKKNPVLLDFKGKISALECKHGANGWHPHQHDLFFFGLKLTAAYIIQLQKMLAQAWIVACEKVGLPAPSLERGVDIRRAMNAEDYLTKFGSERFWTIDRELTKGSSKNGNSESRTPFRLLYDYASGDHGAGQLFRTFANGFKGRHQLQFSVTLKKTMKLLGVDLTDTGQEFDEWLAAAFGVDSKLLGELTDEQFDIVRTHNIYAEVLFWCESLGHEATMKLIDAYAVEKIQQ